jgi:hypothetical protein
MEKENKGYYNVRAYKSDSTVFTTISAFACFFAALTCVFSIALLRNNMLYLLLTITSGVFALWLFGLSVKRGAYPKLILEQRDEELYFFPETKKQIIIPLKEVVGVNKKNSSLTCGTGKLVIVTKTNRYALSIIDLNEVFKRLDENIKLLDAKVTKFNYRGVSFPND